MPAEILRIPCPEVKVFDAELAAVAREVRSAACRPGRLGVAAPQIGLSVRLFVVHLGRYSEMKTFVNPHITYMGGEVVEGREGCLSIPGLLFDVRRCNSIRVSAKDIDGNPFTYAADMWESRALQHEIDHLDGILVVDRVQQQLQFMNRQRRRATERELAKVRM
jgi:peptide deformylase